MSKPLPTGIKRTASGYRTFQWVPEPKRPEGRIRTKRWPADASITDMKQWREDQRVEARKRAPSDAAQVEGFARDAAQYLDAVKAMPSFKDRARDMGEWIARFGERPSLEVLPREIRSARDAWLTEGPKRAVGEKPDGTRGWLLKAVPLAAATVNHRLRALENFYTVMYPGATNPVREVPEATEPPPKPRGHSFALALEILSHMPDITTPKKGETPEPGSLSRVRFETMLWSGLPPVQVASLQPHMVDWVKGTLQPAARQKGRQSRRARHRQAPKPRPLLPQALDALKRFFALNAHKRFSTSSLDRSMKRAIAAANKERERRKLPTIPLGIRLYDITRHTFGTEAMRASGNLKAVQDLMGHSEISQTERYAAAAVAEQTVLAIAEMSKRLGGKVRGKVSPSKRSRRVRSRRRTRRENAK